MTSLLTSRSWSEPIIVAAGDILQNTGNRSILICAETTADADDSLLIRPRSWFICLAAMTIRVATHGIGIGRVTLGRGLGEDDGIDAPEPIAPAAFAPHQWGVSTGTEAGTVDLEISGRPNNGGSALTAFEYTTEDGDPETGTSLEGLGTGIRVLSMPEDNTEYSFRIRAVNSVDAGPWSDAKAATSGATAELPDLTAEIDLQPAGQESYIEFSAELAEPPTIAQGQTIVPATRVGTSNRWIFVAVVQGPIAFAATAAGHEPFSDASRTVAPAPSVLVIRDRELVVDNEPTADRTLDINAPDRFDATGINIAADQYTDGMKVIAAPVIERNGDVITASRGSLFSWFAEQEPVFFSHNYYRGTTPQTATLIPGTADVESYTVDPVADGGKNIYRRDRMQNALQTSAIVFSNGIAVAEAQGWWNAHANLLADIDYTNNRARINGVTYSNLADAEAASAIKTLETLKYIDTPNLSAFTIAASAPAIRNATTAQVMVYIDDGDDGDGTDNYLTLEQTSGGKMLAYGVRNGSVQISMQAAATINSGATVKIAGTFRGTTAHFNVNGEIFNDTSASAPAGAIRLGLFNKAFTARPWLSDKGRIIFINAAMTDAEIATLYGEI